MAHKKGQGSTRNGRDSESKRLGVKIFGGEVAIPGNIIIRQRGTKFYPGLGVGMGKDHTIFAKEEGVVSFRTRAKGRTYVSVLPIEGTEIQTTTTTTKAAPKKEAAPKVEADVAVEEAPAEEVVVEEAPAEAAAEETKEASSGDDIFAVIGTANEADANDLKKISGLGPAMEGKLNEAGIYTYEQISKCTEKEWLALDEIVGKVSTKALKDDWAAQAKELMNG